MTALMSALSDALLEAAEAPVSSGAALDAALEKGRVLVSKAEDPATRAALVGVLDVLSTDEARSTLSSVASHELGAFALRLGIGQRGIARALFLADGATTFAQRHAVLASDDQATRQATREHAALVDRLETLAMDMLAKGGSAAIPLLFAIF